MKTLALLLSALLSTLPVKGEKVSRVEELGKVVDAHGAVSIRPVMQERWTPVENRMPLQTGDWIRTDVRGGNAARVRLDGQAG
jgi:hypothetical protein